ncbi:unnamed protein product, partial [Thlaspi arvense]
KKQQFQNCRDKTIVKRHGVPRRHSDVRSAYIGGYFSAITVDSAVGSNQQRRDVATRLLFSVEGSWDKERFDGVQFKICVAITREERSLHLKTSKIKKLASLLSFK